MKCALLFEAIPDPIELSILAALFLAAGSFAGFFYFRIRHRRELGLFAARETALSNKQEELDRLLKSASHQEKSDRTNQETLEATITLLREEIEQKSLEIDIAREDHELEVKVLRDELSTLKGLNRDRESTSYEIEDVEFVAADEQETDRVTSDPALEPGSEEEEMFGSELETHENDSLTEPSSITGWAASLVSGLIDDVVGSIGEGSEPKKREDLKVEEVPLATSVEAETGDFSIPPYPVFTSLSELFNFHPTEREDSGETHAAAAGLQLLLGLSDDQFVELSDLGYDSYERIAELSDGDIVMLSEKFHLPAEKIQQIWISGAQLRLFDDDGL